MRSRLRHPSDQDGAAAVEFAIVAPLLFMLLFGIIQFGILFAQDLALSNGARQGARTAAVVGPGAGNTCQDVINEVRQGAVTIALNPSNVSVDMSRGISPTSATPVCVTPATDPPPCTGAISGEEVYVTARFTASLNIPLFGGNNIDLEREGSYRCEYA